MKTSEDDDGRKKTADLIGRLADNSGLQTEPSFDRTLVRATMLALVAALATVLGIAQPRSDFGSAIMSWAIPFKVAAMALLICGAFATLRRSGMPGCKTRAVLFLLPVILLLGFGVTVESSSAEILGAHRYSVPTCVGTIIIASIGPLIILLKALRSGVPTKLRLGHLCRCPRRRPWGNALFNCLYQRQRKLRGPLVYRSDRDRRRIRGTFGQESARMVIAPHYRPM